MAPPRNIGAVSVRRAFVTGATGFLGQRVACLLVARGIEVHASLHRSAPANAPGVTWHELDLADEVARRSVFEAARPDTLIHLAWNVGPDYQTSPENQTWVRRSGALARTFARAGGQRLLVAGTCAEYDWSKMPLGEESPCRPTSAYGKAKLTLNRQLLALTDEGLGVVWPRLFFLFGEGERPGRVIPSIIRDVAAGRVIDWISPEVRRDYLHADEAATAMVHLVLTGARGVVNVASGEAPTVREIARIVAAALGVGEPMLALPEGSAPWPPEIRADVTRLHKLGFVPDRTVHDALTSLARASDRAH